MNLNRPRPAPQSPVISASVLLTLTHADGSTTEMRVPEIQFDQAMPKQGVTLDFEPPSLLRDDFDFWARRGSLDGLIELPGVLSINIKGRPVQDREHGVWGYLIRRGRGL